MNFFGSAALIVGLISSRQRLVGLDENDYEVSKYGCLTEDEVKDWAKRAYIVNGNLVDSRPFGYEIKKPTKSE